MTIPESSPNPTSPKQLSELFRAHAFRPSKSLGQSFLIDGNIAGKIVRAAALDASSAVLEIGPGAGAVTRVLAAQARRVVAVEIDSTLVRILTHTVGDRVEVIQGDILRVEVDALLATEPLGSWTLVANLPYSITGPALMRALELARWFRRMIVMVQKEVAGRLLAPPGGRERGLLTVLLEAYCEVAPVGLVSRHCFLPPPKVDSTILACSVRRPALVPVADQAALRTVVKAAFSTRRKTILNALSGASGLGLKREGVARLLDEVGIAPGLRAESIPTAQYLALAAALPK